MTGKHLVSLVLYVRYFVESNVNFVREPILKHFLLFYLESEFLSVGYLTIDNVIRLKISARYCVSAGSQYLIRLLSLCWIAGGHTIHPPIEGLLPPTGIE